MAPRFLRSFIAAAALLIAGIAPVSAATIYISEYNDIGSINTLTTPWPPGAALATQTVAVGGASVQSSAFNSKTRAIGVICDVGCSISIGSNPTATTSTTLLQQGVPYNFVVAGSQKIAVIANTAGNTPGGSGSPSNVNIAQIGGAAYALGQTTVGSAAPVTQADATASGTITTQNLVPTGTATAGSAVEIATTGVGTVTIQVTGTYTGALSPQVTTDGTTWVTQTSTSTLLKMSDGTTSATITSGSTGIWQVEVNGHLKFRITGLAAMTGTATITMRGAAGTSQVSASGLVLANPGSGGNWGIGATGSAVPANAVYQGILSGSNLVGWNGNVGGKTTTVCTTPTVTATNSYGTNYVVGGKLTFSNIFTSTGTGILQGVVVTIAKVETSGFTFFPFASDPSASTWTDAAVANINATDIPKQRAPISLTANSQLGTTTIVSASGIGQPWNAGGTSGYGILLANAALTNQFASTSDVQVCVQVLSDL